MYISYYGTVAADPGVSNSGPTPWTTLIALNLQTGNFRPVVDAPVVDAFGWSSTGDLIYTVNNCCYLGPPAKAVPLWAYDPASYYSRPVIAERFESYSLAPTAWSADHSVLLLNAVDPAQDGQFKTSLALITFGPNVTLRRLGRLGEPAILSPNGRQVAYVPFDDPAGTTTGNTTLDAGISSLNLLDVASGSVTRIAAANDPQLPIGLTWFADPRWSADGAQLAWHVGPIEPNDYLISVPAAGGPARVWASAAGRQLSAVNFSHDATYVAAVVLEDLLTLDQYWLFDRRAADIQPPFTGWANSIAWSPKGGRLVMAGAAGVSSLDPTTGNYEWLGPWQDCQLQW
jgi:hypothetical protein